MKLFTLATLAIVGVLSLAALSYVNREANMFTSRSLLSSDDDDCDMESVVRHAIAKFNDAHGFEEYYASDAMRYANGKLDDSTNGRPFTEEDVMCVHKEHKVHVSVGEVVTNGDDQAILTGHLSVDNKVTGLSIAYKFHPGSCKIQDERLFFSTTSELYMTWLSEIACNCFPVLQEIGACRPEAPDADVNLVQITTDCWNHLSSGNANEFAQCFTPMHGVNVNGEQRRGVMDLSNAQANAQMLSVIDFDHTLTSVFAEGYVVHAHVDVTVTNKRTGETVSYSMFQEIVFNEAGKVINLVEVFDDSEAGVVDAWLGGAPMVHYWSTSAADAIGDFAAELGYPSYLSDNWMNENVAVWDNLSGAYSCISRVEIYDEVTRTTGALQRDVFAHVTLKTNGISDLVIDDVRALSNTITVDWRAGEITALESSLGAAIATLSAAKRVNNFTPRAEAAQQWSRDFASVYDQSGMLTAHYRQLLSQLCGSGM